MDVIATGRTENIAEKKKTKNQKMKERRRKKKVTNQANQNVEISSNEKCHGIAEADSYVGPVVVLEESSQVDRAPAEKIKEKKTKSGKLYKTRKENCINQKNEISSNEKCDAIAKQSSYVGLAVRTPLRGLSLEDRASNDGIENKRTAFEDELVLELSKERVLGDAVKENSRNETKKRKRRSKSMGDSKTKLEPITEEHEDLDISKNGKSCIGAESSEVGLGVDVISLVMESPKVDNVLTNIDKEKSQLRKKRKRRNAKSRARNKDRQVICDQEKCLEISVDSKCCIEAAVSGVNGVDSVKSLPQELPEVEEVSTQIAKEKKTPKEKQKGKKKLKARDKDGNMILDKENKCLEISVDRRSCISAPESCIKGEVTVEPVLQESPEVEEIITDIVNKQKTPEEKQRSKIASYYRDNNVKVILGDGDKCLKISADRKSCIEASDTVNNRKTPEEKQRKKIESYYRDNNVKVILGEEDKCLKISADRKCCLVASDIVENQKTPEEKQRRKIESYYRDNNVKVILGEEDKCLKISSDGKCCIAASDIVKNQKTPEEKLRRKVESYYRYNNVKVILGEEDKCPKISAGKKSCIGASVSSNKDIDPNVDSLLQDSPVIVKGKKSSEGKQRQKTKLTTRTKNTVEVPTIDLQDELLVTATNGKCCTKTEIDTLHRVDTRSKFHVDNVSSLASYGMDDLPNDFYQWPRRELTTCSRKILIVLDINGLLADIVMPPPKEGKSDINIFRRAIFKRPYCDDFLNFCFDTFDVGIWSSRTKRNIDPVVDYLLGERKHKLLFCWDRSHTTVSNFKTLDNKDKPLVCKGLRNLWEKRDPALPWEKGYYTESNTLLIDDSPYKALLNPMHTAIFPHSFTYNDQHDNSIGPGGELRVYLQNLAKTDDVRKYVEEHPFGQCAITEKSSSWDFYSKVINSLSEYN